MRFDVRLTAGAQRDLEDLHAYLARHDSPANAERLLDQVLDIAESLAEAPERGAIPGELAALGIQDYRQLFFKPYRIIYRVIGKTVFIYLIADGRRDMRTLLERRLVGG
ncbi:MAG: type II toxin-antitoxin system RelE/ParE family toxin [Rhodospirillales bacterium]|nr:type II toxin-antitoxin system RelE/ParE family toxin [Rhodospirillales bacterium]